MPIFSQQLSLDVVIQKIIALNPFKTFHAISHSTKPQLFCLYISKLKTNPSFAKPPHADNYSSQ